MIETVETTLHNNEISDTILRNDRFNRQEIVQVRGLKKSNENCLTDCPNQDFYCYDKTPCLKASWGGKGLFGLHFHTAVHH